MKEIVYEFADGTKSVIEVDDALADEIIISRRVEENYERKTRYWVTTSLDDCEYEGEWFAGKGPTPSEQYELDEQQAVVDSFMDTLTPIQKRRLLMRMYNPDLSLREIAEIEGTDHRAIRDCFELIRKKYQKFFNKF